MGAAQQNFAFQTAVAGGLGAYNCQGLCKDLQRLVILLQRPIGIGQFDQRGAGSNALPGRLLRSLDLLQLGNGLFRLTTAA